MYAYTSTNHTPPILGVAVLRGGLCCVQSPVQSRTFVGEDSLGPTPSSACCCTLLCAVVQYIDTEDRGC